MRTVKTAIAMLGVLAILAIAAFALRMPLAGFAVRAAMSGAGLENPKARVTGLSFDRIALAGIAAGPEGEVSLRLDAAEAAFDWRALVFERRIKTVRLGPGEIALTLAADGRVSAPGLERLTGGAPAAEPPLSAIEFADIALRIDTPEGRAAGTLSGRYAMIDGGAATLRLEAVRAGLEAVRLENAALDLSVTLEPDGAVTLDGAVAGDVVSRYGAFRGVDLALAGAGRSWKEGRQGLAGDARLEIRAARAPVADAPYFARQSPERVALIFGGPVAALELNGALALHYDETGLTVAIEDGPLVLKADTGAALTIEALDGGPAYRRGENGGSANIAFSARGAALSAVGTVMAERDDAGWRVFAPMHVGAYRSADISIDESAAITRAETRAGGFTADIVTTTHLRKAAIGRFAIFDTPLATRFLLDVDMAAKRATASLPADQCISLKRGRFMIEQQNMEVTLKDATICSAAEPLARIDWADPRRIEFAGALTAAEASYRLSRTRFAGAPPSVDLAGVYQPGIGRTDVRAAVSGGAVVLNDLFALSRADATVDATLTRERFEATASVASARVGLNATSPRLAAVFASGEARLEGQKAAFSYVVNTPDGRRLGAGEGVHDMASARGASTLVFDRLRFEPEGLQPKALVPVLKGVVSDAGGAATGSVAFRWDAAGIKSSAALGLENFTFEGPTRAVTRTIGVDGNIQFTELWPVATDGAQELTVKGVDFGALQLGEGVIKFELPGDDTLRIEKAEFPWFGGALGLYGATASFGGEQATAPLRADNVDLAQVLEYVSVNGLSGEGVLAGVLPLVVENGRARIDNGVLRSQSPGAIRYVGGAGEATSQASQQAKIAFDLLRDLRFDSLTATINGPLDGRLEFQINLKGTGGVQSQNQTVRVPVNYNINLEAALLELLSQANISRNFELQIERAREGGD